MDLSSFFEFDESIRVWVERAREPFAYSDGEEQEQYILDALKNSHDVSSSSSELRDHMIDWPSTYHLTPRRGNLLRPFNGWFAGKRILEIGCGCGAITRFLGEAGATVVSVEGSLMRATIARERCRDLPNVEIVCATSERTDVLGEFDGVMLIGVLEYARKFLGSEGTQRLLADCAARLTDEGKLFVAIENQLGMKYFAGAAEDHTGVPMFGIEERYASDGVATFGRAELGRYLDGARFACQQWWFPFPDYKLPLSVLSEDAAAGRLGVDFGPMITNASAADPQRPYYQAFSPERAWNPVYRNGLAHELSNSFLVIASRSAIDVSDPSSAAFHYSVDRLPQFTKGLEIRKSLQGGLQVRHSRLHPDANVSASAVSILPLDDAPFHDGVHWQHRLSLLLSEPGWSDAVFFEWYQQWLNALKALAGIDASASLPALDTSIDSALVDALPRNFIITHGKPQFFDLEWKLGDSIELGYLLFRGVYCSLWDLRSVAVPAEGTSLRFRALFEAVLARLGVTLPDDALERYAHQERDFQISTAGRSTVDHQKVLTAELSVAPAVMTDISHLNEQLVQKDAAIAVQGAEIHKLLGVLNEKHAIIDMQSSEVHKLNERIVGEIGKKDEAIGQQRDEIHRLQAFLDDKNAILALQAAEIVELGGRLSRQQSVSSDVPADAAPPASAMLALNAELARLTQALEEKSAALKEGETEISRLQAYINEKHVALSKQAEHISDIVARDKRAQDSQRDIANALAEVSKRAESLHNLLTLQAERIGDLESKCDEYREKVLRAAEQANKQPVFDEDRCRAEERAALDAARRQADARIAHAESELARERVQHAALMRTKWFRLRDALTRRPFSTRQLARATYLVGAMATPAFVKRPLSNAVSQLRALASQPADPTAPVLPKPPVARRGQGASSYIVRQRKPDLAHRRRVVHVIANFMTGGSSKLVVDLIEGLGHRYQQTILTSFIPTPEAYSGVDIHELRQPGEEEQFVEFFSTHDPQFIHVHYWGDCDEPWYAKAFAAAEKLGIPVVQNINTPVAPYLSASVLRYVYVSEYVQREFGAPQAPNLVIYPGSDFSHFSLEPGEDPRGTHVGMVYRLERDKLNESAIIPFIRVAQMNHSARVLIVGGGSLLEPFQQAVAQAGVAEQFKFTGYVSYDELPALYREMAVFVAPVWKESFGQVSPFAMNMQVPVVGYDVGAIGEIINNDKYLAPAADAERLAQIINNLLRNNTERNTLARNHRDRAQRYFSLDAMVTSYHTLYEEVLRAAVT